MLCLTKQQHKELSHDSKRKREVINKTIPVGVVRELYVSRNGN